MNGFQFLSEAYRATDPNYHGASPSRSCGTSRRSASSATRTTTSAHVQQRVRDFATNAYDFYPPDLRGEIDTINQLVYERVNNGVYRAGFATAQRPYERAAKRLFETLDELDARLAAQRYLLGQRMTESDWRLFPTLIRFDAVYHGHFKCNLRRIVDYPNLWPYLRDLYQHDGIAETVNFDHIKRHYYMTHDEINPTRIVPIGPALDLNAPHGRDANCGRVSETMPPTPWRKRQRARSGTRPSTEIAHETGLRSDLDMARHCCGL